MVINRSMRQAVMYRYFDPDEYGQPTLDTSNPQTIELTFGLYNHTEVEDVRYQDVEYTGLTRSEVTDKNVIQLDGKNYKVKFVNPYGRMKHVLLVGD